MVMQLCVNVDGILRDKLITIRLWNSEVKACVRVCGCVRRRWQLGQRVQRLTFPCSTAGTIGGLLSRSSSRRDEPSDQTTCVWRRPSCVAWSTTQTNAQQSAGYGEDLWRTSEAHEKSFLCMVVDTFEGQSGTIET